MLAGIGMIFEVGKSYKYVGGNPDYFRSDGEMDYIKQGTHTVVFSEKCPGKYDVLFADDPNGRSWYVDSKDFVRVLARGDRVTVWDIEKQFADKALFLGYFDEALYPYVAMVDGDVLPQGFMHAILEEDTKLVELQLALTAAQKAIDDYIR